MRKRVFGQLLVLALVCATAHTTALASGDDFKMIVKTIESRYNAKRKKIPFLGLANFLVKIVKPAGVKDFKLAIFEDQDFSPGPQDFEFESTVRRSLSKKWQPTVRSTSVAQGLRTYIYSQPAGKDFKLLSVTIERRQAIVVEAKVDPQTLAKFLEKPEIMGISLAGGFKSDTLFGGSKKDDKVVVQSDTGSSSRALEDLRRDSVDVSAANPTGTNADTARPKPVLRTRAEVDAEYEFNPSSTDNAAPAGADAKPEEKELLRLEARLVNLNIKATDRAGNPLADLTKDDFVVYEDGVEQEIAFFEPQSAKINLVLLLDLSGSTEDKRKVMIKAAKKFIDTLDPNDPIALAAFTREFFVLSDFTTDRNLLKKKVEKIKDINGGTAFYDSLWKTFDLFKPVTEARKAIVVLTDGVDNSLVRVGYHPSDHTFQEVLDRVAEEDATIYPIYLDTDEELRRLVAKRDDISSNIVRKIVSDRKRPNEIAREQLEALAEHTAGKLFRADSERDLEGVYERVASELHLLYSVGYAPKNTQNDGKFRKTSVTLKREGSIAKTRRGYYAR